MSIENKHDFDFTTDVCKRCGMTETSYLDTGKPKCSGRKKTVKFGGAKIDKKKPLQNKTYI